MSETLHGNYQSMASMENPVHLRQFFVYVASETRNAHKQWISYFEHLGQVKVNNEQDADYFLVFCPVKSRIKTDIDEALEEIPVGKPVILVVMHHTFNPNMILMESRLQVTRPDVCLTVDCLFYEGRLLNSNLNSIARNHIRNCLGVPASEPSYFRQFRRCVWNNRKLIGGLVVGLAVIGIIVAIIYNVDNDHKVDNDPGQGVANSNSQGAKIATLVRVARQVIY